MAVSDLEAFIRERLSIYDASLDASEGSPLDTTVIQPILRRLGTDPFTVDFLQFAQDRLQQEFPDLATKEGDAITDLLLKPSLLLLDPLVRESVRLKNAQSFRDPSTLTTDEADALGANLFAQRATGDVSRGQGRIYFAAPQSISISPANFFTSSGGLHFFPENVQAIRTDEMLFNTEGSLFYFDVNVVAEAPGDAYNIDPDQLTSVANITAAVRVTNKRRFRFGVPAETAEDFIGRANTELSEKSLVTQRGVVAKITSAFSEVTQVAVVGFGDTEMQRDVITGGGLGPILGSGMKLLTVADGTSAVSTRRIQIDPSESVDFTALIGLTGAVAGYTLTIIGGFTGTPTIRDVAVQAVVNATTLDLADQVLAYGKTNLPWVLRKQELTLSGIPGGILFPDSATGETVSVPSNQIHVGGATDIFIRATDFDQASLVLEAVVDDSPLLSGTQLLTPGSGIVQLTDYVYGTDYSLNDGTYQALQLAALKGYSLQILEGPASGSYRVVTASHVLGQPAQLLVDPFPDDPGGTFRWKLLDVLDINLVEPKETKIAGTDLVCVQNVDSVSTAAGLDFQDYGVGANDILRLENGPNAGDYIVKQVLTPLYQRIQLDRPMLSSASNVTYSIFRSNTEGGVQLPLVRITSVELLDPSGQSTGAKVPYAKPVDVRSRNFANVAHGVKEDLTDGRLGLIGDKLGSGVNADGLVLYIKTKTGPISSTSVTNILLEGTLQTAASIVSQINSQFGQRVATVVDTDRVAILPFIYDCWVTPGSGDTATAVIFGSSSQYSIADVRSDTINALSAKWNSVAPAVDPNYDVVTVLDGYQVGYYPNLSVLSGDATALVSDGSAFEPEVGRHIRLGSRSLGVARLYFLEPTSIEFDSSTRFQAVSDGGAVLNYVVDKTLAYQVVPALPNDTVPSDGSVTTGVGSTLTSGSGDFYKQGVLVGDEVELTYQPVTGTVALADPVAALHHTTLILSVGGGVDKTLIFVNDDPSIGSTNVTRKGVADQINRLVGQKICAITSANYLEFEADISVIIRGTGTANSLLGFTTSDVDNRSPIKGTYTVASLTSTTLTFEESVGSGGPYLRQHFIISRPHLQRIVSTVMSTQLEAAGLYYCDVELISEGTGDEYNIEADVQMTATGYSSDGYWLTTEDPNLTFSAVERPILHVSRAILEVGVSDSPVNATQISGQNLQIDYERSSLTSSVQTFASAEEERVLCESPLVRHLIPYFVRFDASYVGGSKEDVVTPLIETFISNLEPQDYFEVSDLEKIIQSNGATSVKNPIDLIAVIHPFDREITVERSQDKINTGKLAAFVPDILNVKRTFA